MILETEIESYKLSFWYEPVCKVDPESAKNLPAKQDITCRSNRYSQSNRYDQHKQMQTKLFESLRTSDFRTPARTPARIQPFEFDYEHHFIEHEHDFLTLISKNRNF